MQQISPPLRIALIAVVVLAGVWFVALRPKGATNEPPLQPAPTAPGVKGLSNSIEKARNATEAANAAATASQNAAKQAAGESGSSASAAKPSTTKSTVTTKPAATVVKAGSRPVTAAALGAPLVRALSNGKTVVLMFRNRSADSAAVARLVRTTSRKNVVVRVASISQVGKYDVFTRSTTVNQAPTVLVIGPKRTARVIVGYTSAGELRQAIGDVRRSARR